MEDRTLGALAHIWRYPVKSLRAEALSRADVDARGILGDRRSALHLRTPDTARTGKTFRGKEHNLLHTVDDSAAAIALAAARGYDVEVRTEGPFFDARPISLLVDQWLGDLETVLGRRIDPLRFRPNLFVAAAETVGAEDGWIGRGLALGSTILRVVEPIRRCVTVTYDVATGEPDPAVLRAVALERDNVMGVYCIVERAGSVAVGDALTGPGALRALSSM